MQTASNIVVASLLRSFRRSFQIPKDADMMYIAARYENGIMEITLQKKQKL
ncbi:MAG: Hsp20/alpha crystallin family protein [Flavobacteriales bacterium]|nr:Hsp20/alpha crystallin family protein [Flavobacteriales bacterium]